MAALCNGKILNFTKIANDAQVARTTIHEYFGILKDTLLIHEVCAWKKSKNRKPVSTSKYYFFDGGVARFLQNRNPCRVGSPEFGESFENYIFHELKTFADYRLTGDVSFWRSTSHFEVDFILADKTAIEVKGTKTIGPHDLKGLKALREENKLKYYLLVCLEEHERIVEGIRILPWKIFLDLLWNGDLTR